MTIDLDHLRTWIGSTEETSETLTSSFSARFLATFDMRGETAPGAIAPLMIQLCLAPATIPTSELGPDGHPHRGGFLPPVPLPRRMWAGGSFVFTDEIRIGETVTRRSTVQDVTLKQGRSGPLCFVTVQHDYARDGRPVIAERQDIVYRGEGSIGPGVGAPAPDGAHQRRVTPTPPLLFRYSALTFNGHRIHYDAPYARDVEGYPGLIVHGPLQATWLVHHAAAVRGKAPAHFAFRSLLPLFDDADLTLNARDGDDGALELWTARVGGPVAMTARARW